MVMVLIKRLFEGYYEKKRTFFLLLLITMQVVTVDLFCGLPHAQLEPRVKFDSSFFIFPWKTALVVGSLGAYMGSRKGLSGDEIISVLCRKALTTVVAINCIRWINQIMTPICPMTEVARLAGAAPCKQRCKGTSQALADFITTGKTPSYSSLELLLTLLRAQRANSYLRR